MSLILTQLSEIYVIISEMEEIGYYHNLRDYRMCIWSGQSYCDYHWKEDIIEDKKISDKDQEELRNNVKQYFGIELDKDFFDFGDLTNNYDRHNCRIDRG